VASAVEAQQHFVQPVTDEAGVNMLYRLRRAITAALAGGGFAYEDRPEWKRLISRYNNRSIVLINKR